VARKVRIRLRVEGLVQGVGLRPFVHALAVRLQLAGFIANDTQGAVAEVEGTEDHVSQFLESLVAEAPPLASIEALSTTSLVPRGEVGFEIMESVAEGESEALISPDVATCADCVQEIFDPASRRYGYPFTNCTNCGPRFTIVRDIPYDRLRTTMAQFSMCPACAEEYNDPSNRRFHAQPICCAACGPQLHLLDRTGREVGGDPLWAAAERLRGGSIVAVKGLGGYHLAVAAANEAAVETLRSRKHRHEKPFAIMVSSLATAREVAELTPAEERTLASPRRPIVLVRRKAAAPLAGSVAPGNRFVGLMLPYAPLHHLLCKNHPEPFVLTSGNVADEPIVYSEEAAIERLSSVADFFLSHDRPIHMRTDDSVVRVFRERELPLRRSRGYCPQPLSLPWQVRRPVLACGGELKSTFCLAKGPHAFLSHHIGDLENYETLESYLEGIAHFSRLFDVTPQVVVHDLHPDYLSTKYALALKDVDLVAVQHHHAHAAACLAENGERGPAIAVVFDGLGYGTDGTLWGGEFLEVDLVSFRRIGYFETMPMPGGVAAIRQPWRLAAAYLDIAYEGDPPLELSVLRRHSRDFPTVVRLARSGVCSPQTSSAGRLFDAVASILGVRDTVAYEAQAAIELEQRADPAEQGEYRARVSPGPPFLVCAADLVRAVADDARAGVDTAAIAARFHNGLARVVVDVVSQIREHTGLRTVALSGGVFQNSLLLEKTVEKLEERAFHTLTHVRTPPNDGAISFGQAVIAAARDHGPGGLVASTPAEERRT
jgi:hydrogenase maturation protein HypF